MSAEQEYTTRLEDLSGARWKRALRVQAPYGWHIRRIAEGRVLDVGCGIGRNLHHLEGRGVGVDTNSHSVEVVRQRGFTAYTSGEFPSSPDATLEGYASLLFAHVLEHMDLEWEDQFKDLTLKTKPSDYWHGQCFATYQSDPVGVRLLDLLGEGNIMWGSDFPHPDGIWPDSSEFIDRELGELPEATRRKITCENAGKLYGFL